MPRIDILVYKMNAFDAEEFTKKMVGYFQRTLILIFDFEKVELRSCPKDIDLKDSIWRFVRIKNKFLNIFLLPVSFLLDLFIIMKLFLTVCLRYRPNIFWTDNVYAACMAAFFKIFGLCNKLVYCPGDWLVNSNNKKFLSHVANNLMFPVLDLFACHSSNLVLYGNERLRDVRTSYWGRKIEKRVILCPFISFPGIILKVEKPKMKGNTICFLGDRRLDSGLDIAIRSLFEIRKRYDIVLKAIGPVKSNDDYFKKLAEDFQVSAFVKIYGYLPSEKLAKALDDCFCGLNMLTIKNSYSYYAFPGKLAHYIQHLLPIILTEGAGFFVSIVQENSLGKVIVPSESAFEQAVIDVYEKQEAYRSHILEFIKKTKPIRIDEIVKVLLKEEMK